MPKAHGIGALPAEQEGKEPLTPEGLGRGDGSSGNGSWVGIADIIHPPGNLDTSSIFVNDSVQARQTRTYSETSRQDCPMSAHKYFPKGADISGYFRYLNAVADEITATPGAILGFGTPAEVLGCLHVPSRTD